LMYSSPYPLSKSPCIHWTYILFYPVIAHKINFIKYQKLTWFERPKLRTLTLLDSAWRIASSISLFNVSLCHLKRYYKSIKKKNHS
jgi:hypothetical protein